MNKKSRLHIPQPSARPGDKPDFSYLELSPAGSVDKPPIDARTRDIESLSSGLVRVLDDEHQAVGPWVPDLDPGKLQIALRWMMLNRVFDKRMWQIQRQGRISFYMEAAGEEAVSIAQGMALRPGDMCFPSYRNQGLYMYRGVKLVDMMCQCLSNTRDMCKGRQLPIMYHSAKANVFSISGNLGTQYPQAVGWAMASAIKGEDHIAATWVGDGATAEADFHHAMTFAAGKSRSKDHVGLFVQNGLQQLWILLRVVLQVRVLDQHDIATHVAESGAVVPSASGGAPPSWDKTCRQ